MTVEVQDRMKDPITKKALNWLYRAYGRLLIHHPPGATDPQGFEGLGGEGRLQLSDLYTGYSKV